MLYGFTDSLVFSYFGQGTLDDGAWLAFDLFLHFTRKLQIGNTNLGTTISEEIAEICFF